MYLKSYTISSTPYTLTGKARKVHTYRISKEKQQFVTSTAVSNNQQYHLRYRSLKNPLTNQLIDDGYYVCTQSLWNLRITGFF